MGKTRARTQANEKQQTTKDIFQMTFEQWADDYATRFPGFGNLLEKSNGLQDDFCATFRCFPIEVLQKATLEITLLDPQPFPNDHIPKLLSRCRSLTFAPRTHSAVSDPWYEPRYKCLDCRDGGTLMVYHPIGYSPIRNDCFEISKHLNSITVACTCEAGEKETRERRYKSGSGGERVVPGLKRFDSKKMKVVTATRLNDQVDELTEFVLSGYQVNKFSGFEEYA
jgi:hypothetical protein